MKLKTRLLLLLAVSGFSLATTKSASAQAAPGNEPRLYCVGYSHLDTQWRWSYPQVISEFLHHTLSDNFDLFEKYPDYIFNFTGSNRYMMFKEYYPNDYPTLKKYIAAGRWFPGGSSVEEGDVNMPDGEAIIRQVLYGNKFFQKEFGKQSCEYMLPDCFGFQATLPSILAHCGLKGFSTQKLTWGSAVGIPFNVGVWQGPDGREIVCAFNPGAYDAKLKEGWLDKEKWPNRLQEDVKKDHVAVDYRYYGAGDRGGSVGAPSIKALDSAMKNSDNVKVISATSEQMFVDLTPEQIAKLPRYKGDLLLTGHSTGELTSEAFMKRCERKNEQLADAAERASVAAEWLGSAAYPLEKLNAAWTLLLGGQFHDTMAGTALPKSYEYSWNNEILAANQFQAVATDAAGAVIRGMDTRTQGIPVVVYNPLTVDREDVAEAHVSISGDDVTVYGPDGKAVPTQVISNEGGQAKILFLAKCSSAGMAVYEVRSEKSAASTELKVTDTTLENNRLKVTINADGDISSIFDKQYHKEVLSAPSRLEMLYENPEAWPAWNMDYADRMRKPKVIVGGPAKIKIVENGPARIAIEVEREAAGSKITQTVRLSPAMAGGDHVEIAAHIDWQTKETSLEAVFPMSFGNPNATYESQTAAVQRGNNTPKKFEVPQQQWFDLTATDGDYGAAILNDSKYGSDKPNDNTVRLTLLYTPGTRAGYEDQGSQDIGRHEMVYAIAPHAGSWEKGGVPFQAQRLNQPLLTFLTPAHEGPLGKSFSLCRISNNHVSAMAIKKAEDSDEIIIRLHEVNGQPAEGVHVKFAGNIVSAREVDGQEREMGKASIHDGSLMTDLSPFGLRAFAIKLAPPAQKMTAPVIEPLKLAYDLDAVSNHEHLDDGSFDGEGHTFAGESWPESVKSEGISFDLGPKSDGAKNAVVCKGQTIPLPQTLGNGGQKPASQPNRVYVLAASNDGDVACNFQVDGKDHPLTIQDWSGYIGQWDNRIWQGVVPGLTYSWKNKLIGLTPAFIKPATVGWFVSHRHDPQRGNEYYKFTYLYKYAIDLPAGAKELKLPDNDKVRVFAVTAASDLNDETKPARPLFDTFADRADLKNDKATFSPDGGKFSDSPTVTIQHPLYYSDKSLHYTLDGSEPTAESPVYTKPFMVTQKTTVKVKQISENGVSGPTSSAEFDVNDITPPTVTASAVSQTPTIAVHFSKPVKKEQAETVSNYKFQPELQVSSARLDEDGTGLVLTLENAATAGSDYHLTITGVTDLSANSNPVPSTPLVVKVSKPVFSLDSYSAKGDELEKKVSGLPTKANDAWTINLFVKPSDDMEDETIIAGFGHNSDSARDGSGRYLAKFSNGIHFWSRNADGDTSTPFDIKHWQMVTMTFDGKTLRLYKDGKSIGENPLTLSDDNEAVVRIAPLDPWGHQHRFRGEVRNFNIWNSALAPEAVLGLTQEMPK